MKQPPPDGGEEREGGGDCDVKVALQSRFELSVTTLPQPAPVHPEKNELDAGMAVRITLVPTGYCA